MKRLKDGRNIKKMKNSRSQYILYKNCDGKYDAGNKFTNDVIEICKRQKFQAIGYGCNGSNNFVNRIACFTKYIFDLLKIYNSSIIYILYPTMPKYFKCLCYIKRVKKCKLVGIVMDLPFLFIENADSADERNQLLKMDAIIVQNEKQRALLRNIGIWDKSTEEIEILDFLGTPKINSMSVWGGKQKFAMVAR